jgi:hypothetical protein
MFDKHRLLREGVEGEAVVTANSPAVNTAMSGSYRTKIEITIQFEDATSVDFSSHVQGVEVGFLGPGSIVPVRYDAADHRKVVLDLPALRARHAAEVESRDQAAIARSRAPIARGGVARETSAIAETSARVAAEAAAFAQRSAAFRDRAAGSGPALSAILRAKQAGDLAEVERLKAQFTDSTAESTLRVPDDRWSGAEAGRSARAWCPER